MIFQETSDWNYCSRREVLKANGGSVAFHFEDARGRRGERVWDEKDIKCSSCMLAAVTASSYYSPFPYTFPLPSQISILSIIRHPLPLTVLFTFTIESSKKDGIGGREEWLSLSHRHPLPALDSFLFLSTSSSFVPYHHHHVLTFLLQMCVIIWKRSWKERGDKSQEWWSMMERRRKVTLDEIEKV